MRFHLHIDGGIVKAARFRRTDAPILWPWPPGLREAAAGPPGRSVPGTPADWASKLGVPAEKLGRLLIVEDALRAALAW